MRPAEFTPETIIRAGEELQAIGRNITGFALRQKVGGGNPSRLKQVWDEHINSQSVTKAEPVAELPVEVAEEMAAVAKALTDRLANLAVDLNDKAVKAAERRVAEVIRTAGEQREQAERELADASQTVEDLESKLDGAKGVTETLEKRVAETLAESHAQAVELAKVRERLALVEQGNKTTIEEHAAELARLNASIESERLRYQQQIEQLQADMLEQKKILRDISTERDQIHAEMATIKAKSNAAEHLHQEQRKQAAAEAQRMVERLAQAKNERDAARTEANNAREDAAKLRGQVETMQTQVAHLTHALTMRRLPDDQGKSADTPQTGKKG